MKVLVIVDMQKDFVDGSLSNEMAQAMIQNMCEYIKTFDGKVICTLDTHSVNYLGTMEGHYLPVEHCIKGSDGWNLNQDIYKALRERQESLVSTVNYEDAQQTQKALFKAEPFLIEKQSFGFLDWKDLHFESPVFDERVDEIILVGTCTDICVISNALILKAAYPDIRVSVLSNLCAGLSKEKHEAALEVMKSCQVEVK